MEELVIVRAEIKIQFNYILISNMKTRNVAKIYNSEEKVAVQKTLKSGGIYCSTSEDHLTSAM